MSIRQWNLWKYVVLFTIIPKCPGAWNPSISVSIITKEIWLYNELTPIPRPSFLTAFLSRPCPPHWGSIQHKIEQIIKKKSPFTSPIYDYQLLQQGKLIFWKVENFIPMGPGMPSLDKNQKLYHFINDRTPTEAQFSNNRNKATWKLNEPFSLITFIFIETYAAYFIQYKII